MNIKQLSTLLILICFQASTHTAEGDEIGITHHAVPSLQSFPQYRLQKK